MQHLIGAFQISSAERKGSKSMQQSEKNEKPNKKCFCWFIYPILGYTRGSIRKLNQIHLVFYTVADPCEEGKRCAMSMRWPEKV